MRSRVLARLMLLVIIFSAGIGSAAANELLLSGATMGTTYHVKVAAAESGKGTNSLQARIDQRLEQLNQSMSTYRFDSEISRFNRLKSIDTRFEISDDFLAVMLAGDAVYRLTDGAWDGTVSPLVNLWGFGPSGRIDKVPSRQAIADALRNVGFDQIEVSAKGFLKKHQPEVTIDLASIAKGYGVDQIAELLEAAGFKNYLVEIGGEVYASGRREDGRNWRVGINQPAKAAAPDAVYAALELQDQAMATSGDYRNFEEIDGRAYSHIIDPHSGYPVGHGVVSTSVVAPNCTLADGLATALMVMGPDKGIGLLNRLDGVEGLIIVRKPDGSFENHWSNGLAPDPSLKNAHPGK
jgi:thiamine biosynthesis lipoprotein